MSSCPRGAAAAAGLLQLLKRRLNKESKNGAHLFGVDDAFDVFGQRRTGAEEADEHGQVHESLSAPHLHLSDSAVAPLLPGFREACACWGGGGRARTNRSAACTSDPLTCQWPRSARASPSVPLVL